MAFRVLSSITMFYHVSILLLYAIIDVTCIPLWRRQWHPTPVLLPGKSHGRRSLVGCSPWGCWGSDTTSLSLSRIGERNGNPLQCSCLENPRDGEPGGLPSMGLHRVGHDWRDLAAAAAYLDDNKNIKLLTSRIHNQRPQCWNNVCDSQCS